MYGWFIDAMLDAMEELSGERWSPGLAEGWRELIGHLADLMIAELPGAGVIRPTES